MLSDEQLLELTGQLRFTVDSYRLRGAMRKAYRAGQEDRDKAWWEWLNKSGAVFPRDSVPFGQGETDPQ